MGDNRTLSNLVAALSGSRAASAIAGPAIGECAAPSCVLPPLVHALALSFGASGAGKVNAVYSVLELDLTSPVSIAIGTGVGLVDPNGNAFKGGFNGIKYLGIFCGGTGELKAFGHANDPASLVSGTPGTNGQNLLAGDALERRCGQDNATGYAVTGTDVLRLAKVSGSPVVTVLIIGTVDAV